ncbi:MAG: hypothetical protein IKR57_04870 [Bacilli bacterium]|nr:hypothetical protein [Bacilli bacterium]
MNKIKKLLILVLFIFLFIPNLLAEEKELNLYLFYGAECPHCAALEKFLDVYLNENKDLHLYKYEVWHNDDNVKKYDEINKILGETSNSIPYLIIGKSSVSGYNEKYTPDRIKETVNYYRNVKFKDEVGIYLGVVEDNGEEDDSEKYKNDEIDIPIIGKKRIKDVSILLSSIVIGLVDGFNPCAMWILLFLISMLLGMKDKKRRLTLGITFLVASALVYFLFLLAWLDLAVFLNKIIYIRLAIAMIAIIFGTVSIVRFLNRKKDDGCEVVDSKNRRRIINSIKKIVKEKSFILALLGVVLLAVSVNVIELLCSLGLPVMFSEILALNEVPKISRIIYSLVYVFFFLIDDIIIFIIAMKTLEIKAISNKFGKYSHLIGGLIMLLIGILMIYKPEWLMFNF